MKIERPRRGGDATSAEIDRPGDETRPDSVALERERSRIPSLYDPCPTQRGLARRGVGARSADSSLEAGSVSWGALVVPAARQVLLAFAGIGLFTAVLTYGLSEGSFIESGTANECTGRVRTTSRRSWRRWTWTTSGFTFPVRTPETAAFGYSFRSNVDRCFREPADGSVVDPSGRGLLLEPTGAGLYDEFREALAEPLASTPEPLAEQLTDALLRRFEFVAAADPVVHVGERRVTVAVSEGAFGPIGRFDEHPVASFLAVGFAAGLEREIVLEVSAGADPGAWLVSCRWDTEDTRR